MMSKKNKTVTSPKKPKKGKTPSGEGRQINRRDILRVARLVFEENEGRVLNYKQVCYAFGKTNMGQ